MPRFFNFHSFGAAVALVAFVTYSPAFCRDGRPPQYPAGVQGCTVVSPTCGHTGSKMVSTPAFDRVAGGGNPVHQRDVRFAGLQPLPAGPAHRPPYLAGSSTPAPTPVRSLPSTVTFPESAGDVGLLRRLIRAKAGWPGKWEGSAANIRAGPVFAGKKNDPPFNADFRRPPSTNIF